MDLVAVSVGQINFGGQWTGMFMARRQNSIEIRCRFWSNSACISYIWAHLARRGTAPWFQTIFLEMFFS